MLEDDLDETLGPALRAAMMTPLFRHDPGIALRVLTTGMSGKASHTLRPLRRIFPSFYRLRHRISETIWSGIGSSSQRRSTASSTSGKTARISSARLSVSQISRPPRS